MGVERISRDLTLNTYRRNIFFLLLDMGDERVNFNRHFVHSRRTWWSFLYAKKRNVMLCAFVVNTFYSCNWCYTEQYTRTIFKTNDNSLRRTRLTNKTFSVFQLKMSRNIPACKNRELFLFHVYLLKWKVNIERTETLIHCRLVLSCDRICSFRRSDIL